jgi:hypothetical protein
MSLPVPCHLKLNAKWHGTCNAEDYDRIKYTSALVWHLKQRWKHATLLSKWQKLTTFLKHNPSWEVMDSQLVEKFLAFYRT